MKKKQIKSIKTTKSGVAPLAYLIGIIITLLSGFLITNSLLSSSDVIVSSVEDKACLALTTSKETTTGKLIHKLADIRLKCKKEQINIESTNRNEVFQEIANSMSRCWYRYGEGKNDFLGNFGTEGDWCFTCTKLSFDAEDTTYDYSKEFIPWTKENALENSDGEKKYYDYLNLRYYDGNGATLQDIGEGIENLRQFTVEENDPTLNAVVASMSKKNEELMNLALKQINTNEEIFIVYRYTRVPETSLDILGDVAVGFATGMAIESALFWTVGIAGTALSGGLLAPVVATLGSALESYHVVNKIKKSKKLHDAYDLAKKIFDSSKKASKFTKPKKHLNKGRTIKTTYQITNELLRKLKPGTLKNVYTKYVSKYKTLHLDDAKEIGEEILQNEKKTKQLQKLVSESINNEILTDPELAKYAKKETELFNQIKELKQQSKQIGQIKDITKLPKQEQKTTIQKINKILRTVPTLIGGAIGATITVNYNSANVQYIDLLTKEQYYRNCGTEPIITK